MAAAAAGLAARVDSEAPYYSVFGPLVHLLWRCSMLVCRVYSPAD